MCTVKSSINYTSQNKTSALITGFKKQKKQKTIFGFRFIKSSGSNFNFIKILVATVIIPISIIDL